MRIHRSTLLAVPFLALFLAGCPAKPTNGECKTSEDCSAQPGYGKICVEGKCQECGQDTDCKAGFVCRSLKCTPRPECERSDECPAGKSCESGKCMTVAPPPALPVTPPPPTSTAPQACPPGGGKLLPVFFGFDRAVLTPESQAELTKNASCIKAKGFTKITVEGNTDDRGTVDYNLQLGQRRAEAARKFLVNLGVPAKSIKAVTFGKERPVCTEATEDCWAKNRRGDVVAQ
jgi:peptidoglycan-associated lipoprotein